LGPLDGLLTLARRGSPARSIPPFDPGTRPESRIILEKRSRARVVGRAPSTRTRGRGEQSASAPPGPGARLEVEPPAAVAARTVTRAPGPGPSSTRPFGERSGRLAATHTKRSCRPSAAPTRGVCVPARARTSTSSMSAAPDPVLPNHPPFRAKSTTRFMKRPLKAGPMSLMPTCPIRRSRNSRPTASSSAPLPGRQSSRSPNRRIGRTRPGA